MFKRTQIGNLQPSSSVTPLAGEQVRSVVGGQKDLLSVGECYIDTIYSNGKVSHYDAHRDGGTNVSISLY